MTCKPKTPTLGQRVVGGAISALLAVLGALPYPLRVRLGGWVVGRVIAPVAGYRRRVVENIARVRPDIPEAERRRLARAVPENAGRTLIEMFSPEDLKWIAARTPFTGPGLPALDAAQAAGRPVICVSGHVGNYDVGRAALIARGIRVGGLYRKMSNPVFNDIYVRAISSVGEPLFERGRRGMAEMIRHLKTGGSLAILIDQHMRDGAPLTFFGQTAYTALSAAELTNKYDAVLFPMYAIRQPDGRSFEVRVEEPVPHGDPAEMTQALNDSLERVVRDHMDQWLWIHRRWRNLQPR